MVDDYPATLNIGVSNRPGDRTSCNGDRSVDADCIFSSAKPSYRGLRLVRSSARFNRVAGEVVAVVWVLDWR